LSNILIISHILFNYFPANTGSVQQFVVPKTGSYKLECYGSEGNNIKGSYSSGTISLVSGKTLYTYVGGIYSDGAYFNWDGSSDIRLNNILIYTPNVMNLGTAGAVYFGPYWKNTSGIYQIDMSGSGFTNCTFGSYNNDPKYNFTITKMTKTANHFTAYINVDIDVSTYSGIEFILNWNDINYDVSVSQAIMSKLSDRIIIGAGYDSSNSTSGVSNGSSLEHVRSGNGYVIISQISF